MNGPHYREAEILVHRAGAEDDDSPNRAALLALAQVYATLALTAATVESSSGVDGGIPDHELGRWVDVFGKDPRP